MTSKSLILLPIRIQDPILKWTLNAAVLFPSITDPLPSNDVD